MSSPTRRVYLDHNATCPLRLEAREAMREALDRAWGTSGNPSSPHRFGHEARLALEAARRDVACLVGADEAEIVFVSGGTEADNLAVQGVASAPAWRRRAGHVITSAVEHPAVLEPCRDLQGAGWRLTMLPVDGRGVVDPEAVRAALAPDTALVSIMAANNETGVLQPIEPIAAVAREAGVPLHVDAVQAAGKIPLDVKALGVDLLSISAHKIGGPAGIGALYVREGTPLEPLIRGGAQERRRRAGTEAPVLAAGFAAAARAAAGAGEAERMARLRDRMERELRRRIETMRINGAAAPRVANTSSMTFPGVDNEALVIRMDLLGIALSTGSACSTGSSRPSHVLAAMGLAPAEVASSIRVSLGPCTAEEEIDALVEALPAAVAELARGAAVGPGRR